MEIWKEIKGYESYYEISNKGRIKSLARTTIRNNGYKLPIKERILKFGLRKKGYYICNLNKNGGKVFSVHRLVALTFIKNPENKPQVNHKDGIKTNNNAINLEWVTNSENFKHALKNGLIQYGEMNGHSKLTNKQVLDILKDERRVPIISKDYSVDKSQIYKIKNKKIWKKVTLVFESFKREGKLTKEQVFEIIKDDRSDRVLAKIYNIDNSAISSIKNRKSWTHITDGKEIIKGRNYTTKLSEEDVLKIRAEEGLTLKEIGKKYGLTKGTVGKIRNRQLWKHI